MCIRDRPIAEPKTVNEVNRLFMEPRYLVPYISAIIAGWDVYVKPELAPRKNMYGITIYASQLKIINSMETIKGNKLKITKFFAENLSINIPIKIAITETETE